MNDKVFQIWHKKREHGFLNWISKSTFAAVLFYMIFSIVFQYSAVSDAGILVFLQNQAKNFGLFAGLMLAANSGLWLYRESSYKKEVRRRNGS
jgi:uncharacterized membrane-anchored protein